MKKSKTKTKRGNSKNAPIGVTRGANALFTIGVDEAGRGPIAGPMTLCAVVLPKGFNKRLLKGVDDSKKMKKEDREAWSKKAYRWRREGLLAFYIRSVSAEDIDRWGLSKALRVTLAKVLSRVDDSSEIKLDGSLYAPERFKNQKTIVGGDGKEKVISLASVIAKVYRDKKMTNLAKIYPEYGFERHVGYGTKAHYQAIRKHGLTAEHRRSFLKNL